MVQGRYNTRYSVGIEISGETVNVKIKEAAIGIEPMNKGFAGLFSRLSPIVPHCHTPIFVDLARTFCSIRTNACYGVLTIIIR